MKVVSLLPAATEILAALGLEGSLVGRSHECDLPGLSHLPAVTQATVDTAKSSAELDEDVRIHLESGQPLFSLDRERLAALSPDLVLTQGTCPVCAIASDDVRALLAEIAPRAEILSLTPTRLDHMFANVLETARAMGVPLRGLELVSALKARLAAIPVPSRRQRVAVVEWLAPPMEAGHWTPEVVDASGGTYLGPEPGGSASPSTWEKIRDGHPDALLVAPCGFDLQRTIREAQPLAPILRRTAPRILLMDGNRYLSRPGPGLVEAVEILSQWLRTGEVRSPHVLEIPSSL
jgi:iron complex transport system substrate-binding protein